MKDVKENPRERMAISLSMFITLFPFYICFISVRRCLTFFMMYLMIFFSHVIRKKKKKQPCIPNKKQLYKDHSRISTQATIHIPVKIHINHKSITRC